MVEPAFNQMQVQPGIGVDFASGIRTLMRQDPDIIMVGEIRDLETAEMAIQAALTGHLVLSTLHTNDAPSAITRLLDLGVPAYLLQSTLLGVMAQRLVRTLCPHCKEQTDLDDAAWEMLVAPWKAPNPKGTTAVGKGCLECRMTGYMGRIGIYETMVLTLRDQTPHHRYHRSRSVARQAAYQRRHEAAAHQRRDESRRRPHHRRRDSENRAAARGRPAPASEIVKKYRSCSIATTTQCIRPG